MAEESDGEESQDFEVFRLAIGSALEQVVRDNGGGFTLKWLACLEVADPTGKRSMWVFCPDGMSSWDALGMLDFAATRERASIAAGEFDAE